MRQQSRQASKERFNSNESKYICRLNICIKLRPGPNLPCPPNLCFKAKIIMILCSFKSFCLVCVFLYLWPSYDFRDSLRSCVPNLDCTLGDFEFWYYFLLSYESCWLTCVARVSLSNCCVVYNMILWRWVKKSFYIFLTNGFCYYVLCISNINLDRKSTISNHGFSSSDSFIILLSPNIFNFQNQFVEWFCNKICVLLLSVGHHALRSCPDVAITLTITGTTRGSLTLISIAHSPRVVNPDLILFKLFSISKVSLCTHCRSKEW